MKKLGFCILVNFFFSLSCFATSEIREYKNFSQVYSAAHEEAETLRPAQIWMVYDIDNTLLVGETPLARSEWFDWQGKMIKENSKSPYRVAQTMEDLSAVGHRIMAWAAMRPIEVSTIENVNNLQKSNFRSMVLTARSAGSLEPTLRELKHNNLLFVQSSRPLKDMSFEPANIENPKRVVFENGVMLAAGQDKGLVLKELLAKQRVKPKVVIFVDDAYINIENMARAFEEDPSCHVIAVHYTYTKKQVEEFEHSPKDQIQKEYVDFVELWKRFQRVG